jgi:hypothetical protein
VIVEIRVLANADPSIICTEAGRQISSNDMQKETAFESIRVSFDPDPKCKD